MMIGAFLLPLFVIVRSHSKSFPPIQTWVQCLLTAQNAESSVFARWTCCGQNSHVVVIQPCSFIHFDGLVFLMFWQQPWWEFSFYCNRLLKWRYWKHLFLRRWKQQNSSTGSTYVQHFIITPNSWKLPATQQAPFLSKLKFFHVLRFDWFQSFLGKFEQNIRCSPPKLPAATHMGKIVCKNNLRLEHEMQCLENLT